MNVLPRDFFVMRWKDFLLLVKGYNEKVKYQEAVMRKSTFIMAAAWGAKLADLQAAWPMDENEKSELTLEQIRVIKARYKINVKLRQQNKPA